MTDPGVAPDDLERAAADILLAEPDHPVSWPGRKLIPPPPVSPWHDDWLYTLLFQWIEQVWEECSRRGDRDIWQYVVVGEWSAADAAMCRGAVVRAWVRDARGLREITPAEYARHNRRIRGDKIYPFVLVSFHIHPDRQRVVLGERRASRGGWGCRGMVRGEGAGAVLEPDPSGGSWVS